MADCKYLLEPTGAGTPQQNGLAERPNQTLGNMVRCLLSTVNLPPEYWSWAMIHAVYLKNRLPHAAIGCTPYFAWTGSKPSAKLLRIFGCPIVVKNPGKRPAKLDHHTSSGIFLGYTATDNNVYYRDNKTKRIKIATHVQFDEASMTLPRSEVSPAMLQLQDLGVPKENEPAALTVHETNHEPPPIHDTLRVQLLSDNATLPQRATEQSAGYDIFSATALEIPPGECRLIATDITFEPPEGTYGQLLSRSGLSVKHNINVDYRDNVFVNLENLSNKLFQVNQGDKIAQLVLYFIAQPAVASVPLLDTTARGENGFGSTGTSTFVTRNTTASEDVPNVLDNNPE